MTPIAGSSRLVHVNPTDAPISIGDGLNALKKDFIPSFHWKNQGIDVDPQ